MKKHSHFLDLLLETSYAEFGSALEMLIACKLSEKPSFAHGYFEHSKDEYNHTKSFLEILSTSVKKNPCESPRNYRFNANAVISKGYVSTRGYLIEKLKIKDFIAYVYTNELLAKDSFERILNIVKLDSQAGQVIRQIMDDELRHHGFAEKHFLKYYPKLQPWQLRCYRAKETIQNYTRKFYYKNLNFLEKVLTPIYHSMAFFCGKVILLINLNEFQRNGRNLMDINLKSII
mgnify:CR=1 FL=1